MEKSNFEDWGPYLSYGKDATSEMIISWKSSEFTHHEWIKYGETSECEILIENKWIEPTKKHVFRLKKLKPETQYFYKISRDLETVYEFKTGIAFNKSNKFEFMVTGDIHASPIENIKKTFDLMVEISPDHDFCAIVGDSIMDGNNPEHWNSFFSDAKDYCIQKPIMNSTGNHDTDNEDKYCRFLKAWDHPYENSKIGGYYLMEYGNAVFFFLDSNNAGGWQPSPSDEQYEWLEENLEKYALKDKWIFLFMHHQIYSTGDFSCAKIMHEVFRPLCQEYHVDAVFYGHDHHYECFWTDRNEGWGGTFFFVAGGGGTQSRIDHSIMGDRNGQTKYVWPGRILNVRENGVPVLTPMATQKAKAFRNDEIVKNNQLFGILEPNIIWIKIIGDVIDLKCVGWAKQVYHHIQFKRTNTGKKFSEKSEKIIFES
jgi:predicted phosphodiesterase